MSSPKIDPLRALAIGNIITFHAECEMVTRNHKRLRGLGLKPMPAGSKKWTREQKEQDRIAEYHELSGLHLNQKLASCY